MVLGFVLIGMLAGFGSAFAVWWAGAGLGLAFLAYMAGGVLGMAVSLALAVVPRLRTASSAAAFR